MKQALFFLFVIVHHSFLSAQGIASPDPHEIIKQVQAAQRSLKTVSYNLVRSDTFVTGDTRTIRGHAIIQVDRQDAVFGFLFYSVKEGYHGQSVYDGHNAYATDDNQKTYRLLSRPADIPHALGDPGGQVILTDLIVLDTSKATGMKAWEDSRNLYLLFNYADLKEYDVTKRTKTITIDKKTMLPMAMRSRQETLGKVQDLYYMVKDIQVNDPSFRYNFSSPDFLATYSQENIQPDRSLMAMKGAKAPDFILSSFSDSKVSSAGLMGKPVLLDFWEVWCSPCVQSMPKVQQLFDAYKSKGLVVFGVVNDLKQLEPARQFVEKRGFGFPMLIGNEQLLKDYKVNGVPQYVLIDKQGKISFISVGYSDQLESAIKSSLLD